jgi:hypothetical protein
MREGEAAVKGETADLQDEEDLELSADLVGSDERRARPGDGDDESESEGEEEIKSPHDRRTDETPDRQEQGDCRVM